MKEKDKRIIFGKLHRTPKWKKEEFSELEYEPTSVKELLTEMEDISERIIDLAYSAVLFDNKDVAEEVKFLEVRGYLSKFLKGKLKALACATGQTNEI